MCGLFVYGEKFMHGSGQTYESYLLLELLPYGCSVSDSPFMDGEKTNWHQLVLCAAVIRYNVTSYVEFSIPILVDDGRCRTSF